MYRTLKFMSIQFQPQLSREPHGCWWWWHRWRVCTCLVVPFSSNSSSWRQLEVARRSKTTRPNVRVISFSFEAVSKIFFVAFSYRRTVYFSVLSGHNRVVLLSPRWLFCLWSFAVVDFLDARRFAQQRQVSPLDRVQPGHVDGASFFSIFDHE